MKNYRSTLLTLVSSIFFMASVAPGWAQDPNIHLTCSQDKDACIWKNYQVKKEPADAKGVHFYGSCTVGPKAPGVAGMSAVAKSEMHSCGTNSGGYYCLFNPHMPSGALAAATVWVCCEGTWYNCGPQ